MIQYIHIRRIDPETWEVLPTGGLTIAYTCTDTELCYTTAICHENDAFNRHLGRLISSNRLRSPKIQPEVITIQHPIKEHLLEYVALNLFGAPISIFLGEKNQWVSTFEIDHEPVSFEAEAEHLAEYGEALHVS